MMQTCGEGGTPLRDGPPRLPLQRRSGKSTKWQKRKEDRGALAERSDGQTQCADAEREATHVMTGRGALA